MARTEDETEASPRKKPRKEPNLCIILNYKVAATDGNMEEAQKEYPMYCNSQVLAKKSKCIESALSVDMKEKQTRTIVFKDVQPEIFVKAWQYLEDIEAALDATPGDVMQVVGFYKKYDFPGGLRFADIVLSNYFIKIVDGLQQYDKPTTDFDPDEFVNALVAASSFGLRDALREGNGCFYWFLRRDNDWVGPTMLKEKHAAQLQPLFLEKALPLPPFAGELSKEELELPLFPKYFVKCASTYAWTPSGLSIEFAKIGKVEFQKKGCGPHGYPGRGNPLGRLCHWSARATVNRDEYRLCVERIQRGPHGHSKEFLVDEQEDGDWAITAYKISEPSDGEEESCSPIAFWSPSSSEQKDPKDHWEKGHLSELLGRPKLIYTTI